MWANVQPNDDAQGQPVHEAMTPLPVAGGVETGEAFVEGHVLVCVSTSGMCHVPWATPCMVFQRVCGRVEWLYWQNEFSLPFHQEGSISNLWEP